jgi:predicted XRE-type DNA-binding protein
MMDVEERVFVVTCKIKEMKCEKIRENFERKFHKKVPTHKAIRELLMKFQRNGSVHDDSRNGRPRKFGDRTELVREAFEEDPQFSARRASNMLTIPRPSIHRILRRGMKKKSIPRSGVSHLARRRLSTQGSNVR